LSDGKRTEPVFAFGCPISRSVQAVHYSMVIRGSPTTWNAGARRTYGRHLAAVEEVEDRRAEDYVQFLRRLAGRLGHAEIAHGASFSDDD